jgi:DHA2 family metal-tetracycline-proton antiporter-like MFS transporter
MLPYYRKYLTDEAKRTGETFDWPGGALLAATVALLLMGVTNRNGWFIVAGFASLALFVVRIRAAKQPFIRPALFRNKRYSLALALTFVIHGIGVSLYFLTPKLLSEVYRLGSDWIGFAMVPAAVASSVLGRKGGKLADRKGNGFLFRLASASLLACFILLSSFAGVSPYWIAAFLIFGNVGQSFMSIAMSNSISRTLPGEQVGVGMGLFSMLNFIAQGMAMGVYGIAVELDAAISWNPVHVDPKSSLYSNIYLVLAVLHVGILWFYRSRFGAEKPDVRPDYGQVRKGEEA